MKRASQPKAQCSLQPAAESKASGKDEMNLAEFPFASLRRRGDSRKAIVYEGWITDQDGNRQQQKWTVQGGSLVGLPTEFDERLYVAMMAITAKQGFQSRKVPFSVYEILKVMGIPRSQRAYLDAEDSLKRLVGATIYAEGAFWDNREKQLVKVVSGFHMIEKFWLRYREKDQRIREAEGVAAYIVWSEEIWKSFKDNYIKSLDLGFFYSLQSPIARRLYRLLDKRMRGKTSYEFDVFNLAGKLGMVRYQFPAKVIEKLEPAFDELRTRGFLESAEIVKRNGYTRVRFTRTAKPGVKDTGDEEEKLMHEGTTELAKPERDSHEPYSEDLARLVEDLTLQVLHDPDHLNSNITQAQNLWRQAKLSEEEFINLVYEAKGRTLKYSGNIKKKAGYMGLKNRAPYFFRVLKNLVHQKSLEEFRRSLGVAEPTGSG